MTDSASSSGDTPPERPEQPNLDLRASDADRERVAEHLREAVAEGRLDMEEFGERLDATYKARTYGELAPITSDLPVPGVVVPAVNLVKEPTLQGSWESRIVGGEGTSQWGVAVMSGFERKRRWIVPRRFNAVTVMGGAEIDLRDADFAAREVEINCVAIMGGVNIVVPPGVEVVVRGIGIMGGFDTREEGVPGEPGAPRVIVTGFAFWGGVGVERKLTRAERQALKDGRRQDRLERRQQRAEDRERRRGEQLERHQRMVEDHIERVERHETRRGRELGWTQGGPTGRRGMRPPHWERRPERGEDR
jgi:Domain of unknown function (DUF1707)/Cell wall-active antibiotics response 4TMS YvqF